MKSTRKIISIIMCITIALSAFTIIAGATIQKTAFKKEYVAKHFITDEFKEACIKQLNLKFNVLEKKSNIPVKVFKKVHKDKPIEQIMRQNIDNFFAGRDSSSYNEDVTDYFYKICVAYLEENSLDYKEEDIRNVAEQATRIYSDTVGFSNVEHLKLYLDEVQSEIRKTIGISMCYLLVACGLMYMMYSNSKLALKYITQSIIASGFSGVIVAIISMIAKYGLDLPIKPDIYMKSFNALVNAIFMHAMFVFIVVMIVGIVLTIMIDKSIERDKNRKESRFLKRLDNK